LAADYGRETLFSGNTAGGAPNSLSFLGGAKAAYLYVRAESGGAVKLLDPLTVSLADGGDFNLIWEGSGIFAWAGANQITLANGAKALVDFGQSGQVILTDSFSLSPGQGSPNIEVRLSGASILLDVNSAQMKPFFQNCDFSLFEGAITARITDPSLNEASFVLAASSTGLKAISSSFTDPDSGDEYSLSLAENGQATLKRTKEGSK
jgi:hypothetical protein